MIKIDHWRGKLLAGLLLWILAIGCGLYRMLAYEFEPGRGADAPVSLPVGLRAELTSDTINLLMVVHPQCPCTRAGLEELERLLSRHQGQVQATCFFVWPDSQGEDWLHSPIWQQASRIPGLRIVVDPQGRRAAMLGAYTSSQTYLYGRDDRLLFSGGITGSRGHAGENSSSALLESLILAPRVGQVPASTQVYGCPAAPDGKENPHGRSCCQKS
jgi:hypothetical protein